VNSTAIIRAACKTRGIDPAVVKRVDLVGDDLLLHLVDGSQVRVELSALPAELFASEPAPETDQFVEPMPEHTTLTEPTPAAMSKTRRRAPKKGHK